MHTAMYRPFFFDFSVFSASFVNELAQFLTRCSRSLSGAFLGLLNNRALKSRLSGVGQVSRAKIQAYGLSGIIARSSGLFADQRYNSTDSNHVHALTSRTFLGKRGDNLDRFLLRVKETAESFRVLSQTLQALRPSHQTSIETSQGFPKQQFTLAGTAELFMGFGCLLGVLGFISAFFWSRFAPLGAGSWAAYPVSGGVGSTSGVSFLQATLQPSRGKFSSMESLISHFRLTSEG